jgi:hypothetical protein
MMTDFSVWWEAMNVMEKVYWCIAIPFTLLFIIQVILTFVGGDLGLEAEGDADMSVESDSGIDFQFLSIKNIIAFFTIFAWVGIVCINKNVAPFPTVFISTLSGVAMMLLMATLMYYMGKLSENGTLNVQNAKGRTGTVYLTIPAKRLGMGKVQIKVQGFQTLDALTDGDEIPTGAIVDVIEIINNDILLVKVSGQ